MADPPRVVLVILLIPGRAAPLRSGHDAVVARRARFFPGELQTLVAHIAGKLFAEDEAAEFMRATLTWIGKNLGADYAWPGNLRELRSRRPRADRIWIGEL